MVQPVWEHGYRCHGFWVGAVRWGWVGLSPRAGGGKVTYSYGFSPRGVLCEKTEGPCKNLKEGRRIVERLFQEWAETNEA